MSRINNNQSRDPVCHMMIDRDSYSVKYLGCVYAFCSHQCKDMFERNPHLYVGRPGNPSPKATGKTILKKRTLKFNVNISDNQSSIIISELIPMMGIKTISIKKNSISVIYDLMQVTSKQIEIRINQTGGELGHGIFEELKRALIHFIEKIQLENLQQSQSYSGHSCH